MLVYESLINNHKRGFSGKQKKLFDCKPVAHRGMKWKGRHTKKVKGGGVNTIQLIFAQKVPLLFCSSVDYLMKKSDFELASELLKK